MLMLNIPGQPMSFYLFIKELELPTKKRLIYSYLFIAIISPTLKPKVQRPLSWACTGAAENLAVAQRENEVILMENEYESNYEGYDPNSPVGYIVLSSFQDAYLEKSLDFAAKIENNLSKRGLSVSRGVKQAGFAVLRRATMRVCS
jgi:hypothetical protein